MCVVCTSVKESCVHGVMWERGAVVCVLGLGLGLG